MTTMPPGPTRASMRRAAVTEQISWDLMRLIFLREGEVAGPAWSTQSDETPSAVREHLLHVMTTLAASFNSLDEELRDSLLAVYFASAKKARIEQSAPDDLSADLTAVATAQRIRALVGQHGGVTHWELSDDARTAADSIARHPDAPIPQALVSTLYKEIGRLCGPLWLSGESDGFPDLPDIATTALWTVVADRIEIAPIFDELTHELVIPDLASVYDALAGDLVSAIRTSRERYFYGRNPLAPLPYDPTARAAEIEKRAAHRTQLLEKAEASIDRIVRPILTSYSEHLEDLVAAEKAAAAARELEDQARRAEAGFEHPGPQRYGVSHRGAKLWVTDALRWVGLHDAEVTQQTADGGVDVLATGCAVSVKNYSGTVPVEEIREIFGVAVAAGRTPLLWTSGTLTASAQQFADVAPVGVIRYDVKQGTWAPLNEAGSELLTQF